MEVDLQPQDDLVFPVCENQPENYFLYIVGEEMEQAALAGMVAPKALAGLAGPEGLKGLKGPEAPADMVVPEAPAVLAILPALEALTVLPAPTTPVLPAPTAILAGPIDPSTLILSLKEAIQKDLGVSLDQHCFTFFGKELQDEKSFADYDIPFDSVIVLKAKTPVVVDAV